MKKYTTKKFSETQNIGEKFVKEVLKLKPRNSAVILELQGDLGSGKTTFLQGFAKGLGIKEKILSPTFILMKKFQIPQRKVPQNRRPPSLWYRYFYHVDCYRLKSEKDLEVLGFKEIISDPENIVAIEWPERISKILPQKVIYIKFKHLKENKRELIFHK